MVTYFVICFAMIALVYLRTMAEYMEFKKKHPLHKLKKTTTLTAFCNLIKIIIMFCIPVFNVLLFGIIFLYFGSDKYEEAFWRNEEGSLW